MKAVDPHCSNASKPISTVPRTAPLPAAATPLSITRRLKVLHMCWEDLAFLHWPVESRWLQRRLPAGIEIDTFEGRAWIGITPFRMTQVRPLFCPSLPGVSTFPELNVRTYVVAEGIPGIWFFSLDAMQRLAVRAARTLLNLPYFYAHAKIESSSQLVRWHGERRSGPTPRGRFSAGYGPVGDVYNSRPGHLDYWLTERYCLYSIGRSGRLFRQAISHPAWPLQRAEVELLENSMLEADSLPPVNGEPLVHFARHLDVWACLPEPILPHFTRTIP